MQLKKINFSLPKKFRPQFKFWSRLKISQQIFYGFIIVLATTLLLTLINFLNINGISNANRQILKSTTNRYNLAALQNSISKANITISYIKNISEGKNEFSPNDLANVEMIFLEINQASVPILPLIKDSNPEAYEKFNEIIGKIKDYCNQWTNKPEYETLLFISGELFNLEYNSNNLNTTVNSKLTNDLKKAEARISMGKSFSIIFNFLIIALLALFIRHLLGNLRKLMNPVRDSAETSVNGAANVLNYTAQIDDSIEQLKEVLFDIGRSIDEVSHGAQDTASQTENIIKSIRIALDLVAEVAEIASTVNKNLNSNQENLEQKINQVEQLSINVATSVARVNSNADVAQQLAGQVSALEEQIAGINSFLIAMAEITEQTNLLALNASIEAARAEEHGKGFAVVAERIRNLSDETKKFTSQIKHTVNGIQSVANEVAAALTNIITAVRSSASEVTEVNQEFARLKYVLESLYKSNENIIQAANLQYDGTSQIHKRASDIMKSIENISAQTEQVSASMEELSASSQEINAQFEVIHNKVTETHQVVERQLELAKLTRTTADQI